MPTSITVFDGANSIGGNKVYLEFDGNGVFFDFGINYSKMADYYEEFLSPRPSRGIHDLLFMGLIPNVTCYRHDLIPGDVNLSTSLSLKADAVFLSHAHMDHAGNIGLLDMNIPLVISPLSAVILKAMRDCDGKNIGSEVPYSAPREASKDDERIIKTTDYRKEAFVERECLLTDDRSEDLRDFWCRCPGSREIQSKELKLAKDFLKFESRAFEVDHSIYGATAYAINASDGWIVYTGDLRVYGIHKESTEKFVREAGKLSPKILIIEGTRVGRQDMEESEEEVYKNCLEAVIAEKGLVIADFSPRNFERLDSFMKIAKDTGRKLVVLTKDAYALEAMKCTDRKDRMRELLIYKDLKASLDGFEKEIRQKFAEKLLDPNEIAKSFGSYIVCFSFWDIKHLLDIKPKGGTYVYSSSEAYTEDQVIDFQRLSNWLQFFGMKVKGFSITERDGKLVPEFEKGYHASGHASASEILEIVKNIAPETIIPVHTQNPEFFRINLKDANVMLAENGKRIDIM